VADEYSQQGLEGWLTTAEAAKRLGKTQRRIQQLIREGKLEGHPVTSRLWLVTTQSVEEYLKEL